MQVRVYVVIEIATDDCTYCSYDFCDVFASKRQTEDYIQKRCSEDSHLKKCDFEIREKRILNPEFVT